jgi:hypothetical protein
VAGDVRHPASVAETIDGAHAVVSLGRRRRGPEICTEGIQTILHAMASGGLRRLIVLSNYGVAESRHRNLYVCVSWLLERSVLLDKEHMEALVRNSDAERAMGADVRVVRVLLTASDATAGERLAGRELGTGTGAGAYAWLISRMAVVSAGSRSWRWGGGRSSQWQSDTARKSLWTTRRHLPDPSNRGLEASTAAMSRAQSSVGRWQL